MNEQPDSNGSDDASELQSPVSVPPEAAAVELDVPGVAVTEELPPVEPPAAEAWRVPAAPEEPAAMTAAALPTAHSPGWEWSREATVAPAGESISGAASVAPLLLPAASVLPAASAPASPAKPLGRGGRLGLDLLALVLAVTGGFMGLVGAFLTELQSGGAGLILVVIGAPVVEEALKPSGIYLLLVRWPNALRSRFHSGLLCAISGAVFGVIESLLYTEIYFPEGGDNFILFRFTVTPAMHAMASFLVGYGLSRATLEWAKGERPLPKETRNFFLAGMGLHAAYNAGAVTLGLLGMLDFLNE